MMFAVLACVTLVHADAVYVQMGFSHSHFGCVEAGLAPLEHLLIPRALWCDDARCWQQGNTEFRVHAIVCQNETTCDVELICNVSVRPALQALALTVCGMVAIFLMICCCVPPRQNKDHQL